MATPTQALILLVEDEEMIRVLVALVLRHQGYTVLEARHAMEGLQHVEQSAAEIDLLITDLALPDFSGEELARRLRQHQPAFPVLVITGDSEATVQIGGDPEAPLVVTSKPFAPARLVLAARRILEGPNGPSSHED